MSCLHSKLKPVLVQAASMALALCWTRFKHRAALLEQLAVASLAFNVVTTILDKDDPWQNVQPALVTLPLLLAVDFNEVNKGSPGEPVIASGRRHQ